MDYGELKRRISESECGKMFEGASCVLGRGSENPKYVFVGEAPGAEEDAQGLPFVGRSGKLLDAWMDYCGIPEDEYYITNVIKCRPPSNRNPTTEEVECCAPWLDEQLKVLDPHVVICVGRFAMNHFFPKKKSILKESGQLIDGKYYIVPHPSYFLRRGGTGWEPYLEGLKKLADGDVKTETQGTLI